MGLVIIAATSLWADDISISAQAVPQQVNLGQNIRLQVTIAGQTNINGDPSLPDLTNFQVYNDGRSSNFLFVNGQVSSSIQFTYTLIPKNTGHFTIGPITILHNNKIYSTEPIQISVGTGGAPQPPVVGAGSAASRPGPTRAAPGAAKHANEPIFITTQIDRRELYVNEPLVLTFRYYSRIATISQPQYQPPNTNGFEAEDLPPEREHVATVNGTEYGVTEIKTALFPSTAGKFIISPAVVTVQVVDSGRGSTDPFADEILRNFLPRGKQVTLKSEPLEVVVKPIPLKGRPSDFSGTVGKWSLSARLDRQKAKVGEAVTLEIRIFGEGNVKSVGKIDLPPITGFKVYDTITSSEIQKQEGHVRGVKTFRTLLRPELTGNLTLPPISYAYFDPKQEKFEQIQVPGLNLTVTPGEAQAVNTTGGGGVVAPEATGPGVKVMANDIRYLKIRVPLSPTPKPWSAEVWSLGFGLPPLGFILLWLWQRHREQLAADPKYARRLAAARSARQALRYAQAALNRKDENGFYMALSQALIGYLADQMGLSRSGVTQREIIQRLEQAGAGRDKITQLTELLDECDFARFASGERGAQDMGRHQHQAENLLVEFGRILEKERKA